MTVMEQLFDLVLTSILVPNNDPVLLIRITLGLRQIQNGSMKSMDVVTKIYDI